MANGIGDVMVGNPAAARGIPVLGRMGAFAEGIVYLAIGLLSALGAVRAGGGPQGPTAALSSSSQIGGAPLLWAVGIGLFALVVWKLLAAFADIEGHGSDAAGIVKRASELIGALLYAGLALWCVRAAAGAGVVGGGDEASADQLAATGLSQPLGRAIVGAAGVAMLAMALTEVLYALRADFGAKLSYDLSGRPRQFARALGRIGVLARAVILGVIGVFALRAAWERQPSEARGIAGALGALEGSPYGVGLMSAVALGLGLFGVWRLIQAIWMRVDVAAR